MKGQHNHFESMQWKMKDGTVDNKSLSDLYVNIKDQSFALVRFFSYLKMLVKDQKAKD